MNWIYVGVILMLSSVASAQGVYKCRNSSGELTFSDVPCGKGASAEYVDVRPANILDSGGLREWGQRTGESRQVPLDARTRSESSSLPVIDSLACENAKRDYNFTNGSKSAAPGEKMEKRRAYFRACGLGSPADVGSSAAVVGDRSAAAPTSPRPSSLTSCDQTGCFDNLGNRYSKGAGGTYFGPTGACQLVGGNLQCP